MNGIISAIKKVSEEPFYTWLLKLELKEWLKVSKGHDVHSKSSRWIPECENHLFSAEFFSSEEECPPDLLHAAEQGSSVKVVEVVCNVGYFETGSNSILILSYSEAYRK